MLRTYHDFNIIKYDNLIIIAGGLFVLLLLQAYAMSEECRKRKIQLITIAFPLIVYCFSAVILLNAFLDHSSKVEEAVYVQNMRITSGRSSINYYLDVVTEGEETYSLKVTNTFYKRSEIGDSVNILFNQGAFNIPFAEVEELP